MTHKPTSTDAESLVAAIRTFTVDVDGGDKPNGPAEEAHDALLKALDPTRWPTEDPRVRLRLREANAAGLALTEAMATDTKALQDAAEAFFGGDFSKPNGGSR